MNFVDDDGFDRERIRIRATVRIKGDSAEVDFTGTDRQTTGGVNANFAITLAASGRASSVAAALIRARFGASAASARILRASSAPVADDCKSVSAAPAASVASAFFRW